MSEELKWIWANGHIVGLLVDDFHWDIADVFQNPMLHQLYHEELKRGAKDEEDK